ncbi:hypothetical protein ACQPU1_03640 [Clostridium paraputrificum]|uniref:hypothetical protein n=1 Tax=Clostridium paraputrificum TaxID=29363 RepID=UPI003D341703
MSKHFSLKEKKGIGRLITIFTIIFLVFFSCIYINVLFFNTNDLVHFRMIRSTYIGGTILGILLIVYYIINKNKNKLLWIKSHTNITFLIIFAIMFLIQIILAKSIYFNPGWDVGGVIDHAANLVSDQKAFDQNYFMLYPNNIFIMLIYSKLYKLSLIFNFLDYRFLLVVVNIIFVDLSMWLSLLVCKKIFRKESIVIIYSLFLVLFAFSPWIVIPYSDTLSMLFPILIFYIYLVQKESKNKFKKILLLLLIGILAVIGYQIKPTAIIVIIAIVISEIIYSIKEKRKVISLIAFILLIGFGFLFTKVVYNKFTSNVVVNGYNLDDREDKEVPFTHFIMMGMQSVYVENRGTIYGAYSEEDIKYTISLPTKEAKVEGNLEVIKNRLEEFGVSGYIKFLFNKACWILSDGTFYYGGEGNFMRGEPYSTGRMSEKLQDIFLPTGEDYYTLANILQGPWLLILFLIIYPIFIRNKGDNNESTFIIRLTLTGIVLFLLFFEGRSRYLINHLPFFMLLATFGFEQVYRKYIEVIGD